MSDTLLQATLHAIATRIGNQMPAAYSLDPGEMRIGPDLAIHTMPQDGVAVRWPLGDDEGYLVVALTPDAADLLRTGPPQQSLAEALTERVEPSAIDLAAAFGGIPPMLGDGEELPAADALASGPGDAVSVALDDAGTLRATIGLRLVVSDELMAATVDPELMEEMYGEDAQHVQQTSGDRAPLQGLPGSGAGQDPMPLTADQRAQAASLIAGEAGRAPGQPGIVGAGGAGARRPQGRTPFGAQVGEAHPADFASFDQLSALPGRDHSMALLGEVELGVTAELGRTELTVREVLGLTPGSIIELDRAAGSPVDVVVNGTLIARGEVVVIDEEFGIRITEILGMADEANPFPVAQ